VALDVCDPLCAKGPGPGFQIACGFCGSRTDDATSRKRAAADWRKGLVITPFQQAKLDRLNDEIDRLNHEIDRLKHEIDEQMPAYARAEQERALARGRMSRRLMTICRFRKHPGGWFP
jgi:outer membrane murein-binding lipoprotein Lpp